MELTPIYIIASYLLSTDMLQIDSVSPLMATHFEGTRRRNEWNNNKRLEFCLLIAECLIGKREHIDTSLGYYLGTVKDRRKRFGHTTITLNHSKQKTEGFDFYNKAFNVFQVNRRAIGYTQAAAFDFTPSFLKSLNNLFPKIGNFSFIKLFEWEPHQVPEHDVYTYIEPDLKFIEEELSRTESSLKNTERWHLFAIYVFANKNNGLFPQYYRTNKTERLYTFGCFGLQSISKAMRNIVFNQYHCYDMQAAAYNILLSKVKSEQLHKYPSLLQYASDRQKYRQLIADDTGESVEHIKTALTAMLFGSDLINSVKSDIPQDIRENIAKHPLTVAMKNELSDLRQEVCKGRNLNQNELDKRNDIEKEKRDEATLANKKRVYWKRHFMVWLYQSHEMKALQAMRSLTHEQDNCLLLHDGLYTKTDMPVGDFEAIIHNETGLSIKIDLE